MDLCAVWHLVVSSKLINWKYDCGLQSPLCYVHSYSQCSKESFLHLFVRLGTKELYQRAVPKFSFQAAQWLRTLRGCERLKLAEYDLIWLTEKQVGKAIGAKFSTCVWPEGNERFCRIIRDLIPCKLTPDLFVNANIQLWTTLEARHQNVHADFGGEI